MDRSNGSQMAPAAGDRTLLESAPPELEKRIRAELNESAAARDEDVRRVRDWLARQPHLPSVHDQFILTFLRGCKFSLEKTKRKLDMYFTMRAAAPEFFAGRDVDRREISTTLDGVYHVLLPRLTPQGLRVWVESPRLNDAAPNLKAVVSVLSMMFDVLMQESPGPAAGEVFVLDSSFFTAGYLSQFTPGVVKKGIVCLQEAFPVRVKQIHIVNSSPLLDAFLSIARAALSSKLRDRIHIHGSNLQSLHKHVPQDILPEELGGSAGSLEGIQDAWREKLRKYKGWFRQQEEIKADESLRPGKPRNYDEMFGIEGSFRKLAID